jgi:hypothetical protein
MKPSLVCTHSIAFHRIASNNLVAAFADLVCETMTALAHSGAWFGIQTITRKPIGGRTAGNGSLTFMEKRENQAADDKVLVSLL